MSARPSGDTPTFVSDIPFDPLSPAAAIPLPAGYRALFGIVRVHGTPIGILDLPASHGGIAAAAVAEAIVQRLAEPLLHHLLCDRLIARGLAGCDRDGATLLACEHPEYDGPWPPVTVAVCTRGRPNDLRRCLAALDDLDYPDLDRLVVDNAPENTAVADFIRDHHPRVRYVAEPRPGLNWARNRAIVEARGEILAFTDDDAVPDRSWLKALVAPLAESSDVMATTGLVLPYELETDAQRRFEDHGGLGRGFVPHRVRVPVGTKTAHVGNPTIFGVGANMAFRRSLFDRIGGFDPALDAGTLSAAGGDTELCFRVLKAGHSLVYEPGALVRHRHRPEYQAIRSQLHSWGVGFHAALESLSRRFPDERRTLAAFAWRLLLLYYPRRLLQAVLGSRLDTTLVLAELSGSLMGQGRYAMALAEAGRLRDRFGAEPTAPSNLAVPSPAAPARRSTHCDIDIDGPLPSTLSGSEDAARVHVTVMRGRTRIGAVDLVGGPEPIGRRPLAQAIAAGCASTLFDTTQFRRHLTRRLAGNG